MDEKAAKFARRMDIGEGQIDFASLSRELSGVEELEELIDDLNVGVLPVPPHVIEGRDSGAFLSVLRHLLVSGAGCGPYGGRILLEFLSGSPLPPWENRDVQHLCSEVLKRDPSVLAALVWEDHPTLVEHEPDECLRTDSFKGRLWMVSLAKEGVWNREGVRDLACARSELERWEAEAKKIRS
jgi:hypothetical protein